MTIMEITVSPVSKEREEPVTSDIITIPSSSKHPNLCCLNTQRNLQIAAMQLAAQSRDRTKFDELKKRNQQMVEQMAEHNTYMESLTNQLYTMKNQLRMAEMESETAKRREVEIQKQLDIIETSSAALRKKAEASETYENRYKRAIEVCENLQKKRLEISENLRKLTEVAKRSRAEAEAAKQTCDSMKADKTAAMSKIRLYKKHVPVMLKLIDELASKAGDLPFYTRKTIDSLAMRDVRQQLLGGPVQDKTDHHNDVSESDEDINDLEHLISSGVTAAIPTKHLKETVKHVDMLSAPEDVEEVPRAKKSPTKVSPRKSERITGEYSGRGRKMDHQTKKQHNMEETEKAFNDKLLSRLQKSESVVVQSEILGGHRSIHGKKGLTVREQQAKMMSVAEKVALMKAARVSQEPQPSISTSVAVSRELSMSPSPVKSPRNRRRTNSFDLHTDLRMTPSPEKLTPASSQESLLDEPAIGTEKNAPLRLAPTPSMPHLDEIEPISPIASPTISPKLTAHPSMPQLEEMVQDNMAEEETPVVLSTRTRTAHKASPKKKVTFQLNEVVYEQAPISKESKEVVSKPVATKPPSPSSLPLCQPTSNVEQKPAASEENVALERIPRKTDPLPFTSEGSLSKKQSVPRSQAEQKTSKFVTVLSTKPVKQTAVPPAKPLGANILNNQEEKNKEGSLESTLSTPTKIALKTISSVTTELKSPVKTIPQWSQVAERFLSRKYEAPTTSKEPELLAEDEETPLEICFEKPNGGEQEMETETVRELPDEEKQVEKTSVQKTTSSAKRPIANVPRAAKPQVDSTKSATTEDSLTGVAGRTRSAPSRPSAPKKREEASVPTSVTLRIPTVSKPKAVVSNQPKEKDVTKEDDQESKEQTPTKIPTRTSNTATNQKSLTSKMEQASKAMNKRLKAASTMSKVPIVKKLAPRTVHTTARTEVTKPVLTEPVVEKDKEDVPIDEDVPGPSKVPVKPTARKTKETVKRIEMIDTVPVKRPSRQLKRKAAEDAVPPKKYCPITTPAETLLKKVLDLDCSLDVLSKKIPVEEMEQLKTIDVDTFADIVVEHVMRMKTVDMWHSVVNSWKKRSVELPVNKSEENVLQVAHQLSSEEGDIFTSLTNRLMVKIYCNPNMDASLCHRIVRLLGMCFQAREQINQESANESKEMLKNLVKFLAIKRSTLLGKAIVYLLNRLSFNFVEFLNQEEWKDVRRILVVHSEEDVLQIICTYWEVKSTAALKLPKKEEVFAWIANDLTVTSKLVAQSKIESDQLMIDQSLSEFFQLRSVCLMTLKTFPLAIEESIEVLAQIRTVQDVYNQEQNSDNIISSIFGGSSAGSKLNDPDKNVSKEISVRISALLALMDSVLRSQGSIGRDKARFLLENLTGIIDLSHDVLDFLSKHTDNQPESRRILMKALQNLLTFCQSLTQYKLSL